MRLACRFAAGGPLRGLRFRQSAEQVLHVVADLVRDHIGLREFARVALATAKACLDLTKKRRVEIDAPVGRAIKRSHRGLREAAAALLRTGEQPQARRPVLLSAGAEDFAPGILGIAQDSCDELTRLIGRRAGAPRRLPVWLLVLRASAADHFRAADQNARIDAGRPADQTEHDHGSNAEPAAADRKSETTAAETAAGTAIVLDIVAAAEIVPTHLKRLPLVARDHYLSARARPTARFFAAPPSIKPRLNRQNLPSWKCCR
jgi:hypothetical protein